MSKVQLTSALTSQLMLAGLNPSILIEQFAQWKQKGEYSSYFFGKDGFNRNSILLRHVHMVPLYDPAEAAQWKQAWVKGRRRTSDRYLFYADGGRRNGYLLIYIVGDPGAHDFLKTPGNRTLLARFEEIADKFIHFGKITA